MKRIVALFLLLVCVSSVATAEPKWYGNCKPPSNIADASVVCKITTAEPIIKLKVGTDIPSGVYGVAPMAFDDDSIVHSAYIISVIRHLTKYDQGVLNTETDSGILLNLMDGDLVMASVMDPVSAIFLYSIDDPILRLY